MNQNAPTPQDLVEHALATATVSDCIVIVHDESSANLRWANNTLTTNGVRHRLTATVVALAHEGTSVGSVTANLATLSEMTDLVRAAESAAGGDTAEDAAPLIDGAVMADWDDPPAQTDIGVYAEFAPALGRAFGSAQAAGRILYGFVNHTVTTTYLGSSTGLRLHHVQPTGHWGCPAKPADLGASAWVGGATRDFVGVDAEQMAEQLARRLSWAERRVELPAGRYHTIVSPSAIADLMIDLYWSASARTAHDGQSVFSRPGGGTRLGDQVTRRGVNLFSDPAYPGLECAPFVVEPVSTNDGSVFDNGLPLGRTDWISDGVLAGLIRTRHSAGLVGGPVTPLIDNLVLQVDGGTGGIDDLVAGCERGLLLTCLWYIREVDPQTLLLTGLTRDGVYLVEDGVITAAVNNFRFNESPVDLLSRFTAATATVPAFGREWGDDYFSRTAAPALVVPDFNMSSVSQAR